MSTKLLELDRRYFDTWHNQDADAIAAAFAENSNYTHPALPEPLVRAQKENSNGFINSPSQQCKSKVALANS